MPNYAPILSETDGSKFAFANRLVDFIFSTPEMQYYADRRTGLDDSAVRETFCVRLCEEFDEYEDDFKMHAQ